MSETTMPATEATVATTSSSDERNSYELAFHVLPTVAEGEVTTVFDNIKALITKAGAEAVSSENPERFDLAYDIVKHIEGKNRKFSSAYFGWIRFKSDPSIIEHLTEEMEGNKEVLRFLLIKLTKVEEANPFRFHESLASQKMVTTVEESSVVPDVTTAQKKDEKDDSDEDTEDEGEVDDEALNQALNKDEA